MEKSGDESFRSLLTPHSAQVFDLGGSFRIIRSLSGGSASMP
jgi:hypothetical protein